jgi:hypothetical protein
MDKVKPNSESETLDAPSTFGGRRPSSCWALGQQIATAILTVHGQDGGVECTRAQMMLKQTDGTEINMGGRCKASLAQCIAEELEAAGWPNENGEKPRREDAESTSDLKSGFSPPNC